MSVLIWIYFNINQNPAGLDDLGGLITQRLEEMTEKVIASITGRSHVLTALSVVNI